MELCDALMNGVSEKQLQEQFFTELAAAKEEVKKIKEQEKQDKLRQQDIEFYRDWLIEALYQYLNAVTGIDFATSDLDLDFLKEELIKNIEAPFSNLKTKAIKTNTKVKNDNDILNDFLKSLR